MSVSGRRMLDVQSDAGPHLFMLLIMKYLYIDESIDENNFVVGGILANSVNDVDIAYKQLKKQIERIPMTRKQKESVTCELKSTLLDRSFKQIKRKLLYKLQSFDCVVMYNSKKIDGRINQEQKEYIYIQLLKELIKSIEEELIVVTFDEFNNKRFDNNIINEIGCLTNVKEIKKDQSYNNRGLQFADNVCGVIRRHLSDVDKDNLYDIISNITKTIK